VNVYVCVVRYWWYSRVDIEKLLGGGAVLNTENPFLVALSALNFYPKTDEQEGERTDA